MAEVPGSMLTKATFCCRIFLFSHGKACDANIAMIANFSYFVKNSTVEKHWSKALPYLEISG